MLRRPQLKLDIDRRRKRLGWRIYGLEWLVVVATLAALTLGHGVQRWETALARELGVLTLAAMVLLTVGLAWRLSLSLDWRSFVRTRTLLVAIHVAWLAALPVIGLVGFPALLHGDSPISDMLLWSEFAFWMRVLASSIQLLRFIAAARSNPAFVLVGSFLLLIFAGMLLLMLPVCRVQPSGATSEVGAPPLVALFTATRASCVTGLTVVDTGTYWTGTGQTVILTLIQIGGLGIMTFGAFFALGQRRGFLVRERI
ncbi:MAG: hypothetical protein WEH44_09595, partial [Pirellulaceae bacterium]